MIWPHHANCCQYLGTKAVEGDPTDFYRCDHSRGILLYLARFGPAPGDYLSVPAIAMTTVATAAERPVLNYLLLVYAVDSATYGSLAQGFALLAAPRSGNMICIASPLISAAELEAIEASVALTSPGFIDEPFSADLALRIEAVILGHLRATGLERWARPFVDITHMVNSDPIGPECPPAGAMEGRV